MTEKIDELGALALQAERLESEAQQEEAAPGAPPEPAPQTNAQIIAGVLMLARDTACILFELKSPAAVLTDGKVEQLGDLWGRVADKRGWNLASAMGDYVEEITALMGTIGIARELAQAVVMELDAKRSRDEARTVDAPAAA